MCARMLKFAYQNPFFHMKDCLFSLSRSLYIGLSTCLALSLFPACDKIPVGQELEDVVTDTLVRDTRPDANPNQTFQTNVLLEEFTGHQCGNCPKASLSAHALKYDATRKGRMVVASIHAGGLAEVNASGKYTAEYRTPEGTALYTETNPFDAVPMALVNRTKSSSTSMLFLPSKWDAATANLLTKPTQVGITIEPQYAAATRTVTAKVSLKYLQAGGNADKLCLYLMEDSIISWQKWYNNVPEEVENYVHHDMVRKFLNGQNGQSVRPNSGPIAAGDRFYKIFTFTIPENYREKHCSVVAFVHDLNTKEVRQVEEVEILP